MNEENYETIREEFFAVTNIDLHCLEPDEIDQLFRLLPEAMLYLHHEYRILIPDEE